MGRYHYSMLLQWSDEDSAYIVRFPEREAAGRVCGAITHGATYEEAMRNGEEALAGLIGALQDVGQPLPQPQVYA